MASQDHTTTLNTRPSDSVPRRDDDDAGGRPDEATAGLCQGAELFAYQVAAREIAARVIWHVAGDGTLEEIHAAIEPILERDLLAFGRLVMHEIEHEMLTEHAVAEEFAVAEAQREIDRLRAQYLELSRAYSLLYERSKGLQALVDALDRSGRTRRLSMDRIRALAPKDHK